MKRRPDEDMILQAAFGEADSEALAQVHERLGADAGLAREFEALQHLRTALRDLKEVPECQLSIERVRDSILAQSVRPQRRTAWLWPTLVGAAATALTLVLLSKEPDVTPIAGQTPSAVVAQSSPEPVSVSPLESQPPAEPLEATPAPSKGTAPRAPRLRPSRSTVPVTMASLPVAAPISFDPQPDEIVLRGARWHIDSERPAETTVQIVEVGDETDSGTGMRIATDKNKHDVAIGG